MIMSRSLNFCLLLIFLGCQPTKKQDVLFEELPAEQTGISFNNILKERNDLNILIYEYLYNGGGVAVGDLNGDDLPDIYFTGNVTENKLYLNKGNLKFVDVTHEAGVIGKDSWKTGVSFTDVNGDGLLDIYVCNSGLDNQMRSNELFVNQGPDVNGVPHFKELSAEFNLDAPGTYSTQAAFFDMDKDGDMDMFLLNHAIIHYSAFSNVSQLRSMRHPEYGNRLYRNDNGKFVDVSEEAGIHGGGINFGLGIVVSDVNLDGWPDIYVTNDYEEQDYFYLNNRNGSFSEVSKTSFGHLSKFSMGLDIVDYNNDNKPDIFSLDMLPEDNLRQKLLKGPDEYDKYQLAVAHGYYHQNMRNMLQINQGENSENIPVFSEIGQLSGISNTDWSWSALFADYDNDGLKDLFVTNGYVRDYTNLDFIKYEAPAAIQKARDEGKEVDTREGFRKNLPLLELVHKMPSTTVSNYIFKNKGDLTFSDVTSEWGLYKRCVSVGAAYADLDLDGDLELIVNNTNEKASVYRNNAVENKKGNYLQVKLEGKVGNKFGTGSKVYLETGGVNQYQEAYTTRGFQSSVDQVIHFGLGDARSIASLRVAWPDGKETVVKNPGVNQRITVHYESAVSPEDKGENREIRKVFFEDITQDVNLDFIHVENEFVDFKYEPLLISQLSRLGPRISTGDVNGDRLNDLFIGGAVGQSGCLYLQTPSGSFAKNPSQPWSEHSAHEDIGSVFFDVDNDGDLDLYVISGGNEWRNASDNMQDRLYLNEGNKFFKYLPDALPRENSSGRTVISSDFDHDGDLDLFIGAHSVPGSFPHISNSILLRNDSDKKIIKFTNVTDEVAPGLKQPGLVTDAIWSDYNNDGWQDLIVVGEWMPVKIYRNQNGKLIEENRTKGLEYSNGFWNRIVEIDFDHDGDKDYLLGNLGTNTQLKCSTEKPLSMYVYDFDSDDRVDPIMCRYYGDISYPIVSRDQMFSQVRTLSKNYRRYADYANATIVDLFGKEKVEESRVNHVYTTASSLLINKGEDAFEMKELPVEAQFSAVQSILTHDFNQDGISDILLSGNFNPFKVEYGRCDAGMGLLILLDSLGNFRLASRGEMGVVIDGDIRDAVLVDSKEDKIILFVKNNDRPQVIKLKRVKY